MAHPAQARPPHESDLMPGRVWGALVFVTAVAAALRFPFLGHQSLWLDEIFTREIVKEATLSGLWRHVRATESTPPLFYVLEWLVNARSATAMRVIPALSSTAAAPVSYFAARRFVGPRAALASAACVAVSPMLVSYGTDARSYALLVLTALLTVWATAELLDRQSWRRLSAWVLACALCVWTHYFGAFLVVGEALLLLVVRPAARRRVGVACSAIVILLAPLVPLLAKQSSSERAEFISELQLGSRVETTVRQFAMGPDVPRSWLEAAGLVVFAIALGWGAMSVLRSSQSRPRMLLWLAAFTLAIPLLLSVTGISDRFYARNLMLALPLVIALAAPALLRARAAPLALYLALASVTSLWVATNWRYEQLDWRDALAAAERAQPSAPVLAVSASSGPVIETYLGRAPAPSGSLTTRQVWIAVEPTRPAGHRALTPRALPSLSGFTSARTLETDGFTLALERALAPTPVSASAVSSSILFPGRA